MEKRKKKNLIHTIKALPPFTGLLYVLTCAKVYNVIPSEVSSSDHFSLAC